jgi:hypothetical protein
MYQKHLSSSQTPEKNVLYFSNLLLTLLIFIMSSSMLNAREPVHLQRLNGQIRLDGISDEPAWQEIEPLPLTMYLPVNGNDPSEPTEIRVAYDEHFLYASARFWDTDPSGMRVNTLARDGNNGDDTFDIWLDTFNDKENALWFWTNPAGIRGDIAVSEDGRRFNNSWNTYWDVATVQDERGWFAEIRIPFSSLGFQVDKEQVTIGLLAGRYIARRDETSLYPHISKDWWWSTPSQLQEVILERISAQKPVYLTPYLIGGLGQTASLNNAGSSYYLEGDSDKDLGLDIKYNVTSNLTLDGTLNTDFAQVEADNQEVNLTRFSLFFPEKRQFFQERASIFEFRTKGFGSDRVFHSRRIGLHNGEEVRILGGARLVGREGPWDIGIIDMQTEDHGDLPSENFGVLRMRRQTINEYSYSGGIVTSRLGNDGSYNVVYGLDNIFRLYGDEYMTLKWAQTFDDTRLDETSPGVLDATTFQAHWERRSQEGLNYWGSVSRSGPNYQPEMGFVTRRDFTQYGGRIGYDWIIGNGSRFRKVSPLQFLGFAALRNEDNSVESALLEHDFNLTWKSGANIWTNLMTRYEDLPYTIPFPDGTMIPAGSYTYHTILGGLEMSPTRLFRTNFYLGYGSFFDGWKAEFGVYPTWYASRYFSLSTDYNINIVRFPDRNQGFDAHIVRLHLDGALNNNLSMNGFLQYNSVYDILTPNARFRYNFCEGNDLWIVFNQTINTERSLGDPTLPLTNDRTFLMKYTYTFHM